MNRSLSLAACATLAALAQCQNPVATDHTITLGGQKLEYKATVGPTQVTDAHGEHIGDFVSIDYMVKSEANRPLTFVFNGGPGSASLWLHLGMVGPKRVDLTQPKGEKPKPPYRLVDNQESLLPVTDLVMVDPVGTGYSRPAKPEFANKFFGVSEDIETVGRFIFTFLKNRQRFNSPVYILGESYGGIRGAGLSNWLVGHGVPLAGVIFVSPAIEFPNLDTNKPLGQALFLPTYATTAWYHKKLDKDLQAKTVGQVYQEAKEWAYSTYMPALMRGSALPAAQKEKVLAQLQRYTGLSKEFLLETKLGVHDGDFFKELGRKDRFTVGRLDSRYQGIDRLWTGGYPDSDAADDQITQPFVSCIMDYYSRDLQYTNAAPYYVLGEGVTGPWNGIETADESDSLAKAMHSDQHLKVFVAMGYFDLACAPATAEHTFDTMHLDERLRGNITRGFYPAGHMMYLEESSRKALAADLVKFYTSK